MDEPWKHDAEWKKPDTKDHIWFHLHGMNELDKSIETENRFVPVREWEGGGEEWGVIA